MKSFDSLIVNPLVKKATDEMGFTKLTPIQAQALPLLLREPTDFIGLAATGTGKTAAFGIPLLHRIDPAKKTVQGLILCPTRELAVQVSGQIDLMGKYCGVKSVAIYGGSSYSDQIHGLKTGASIVVATPGRLVDFLEKQIVSLKDVHTVVLDEADEMISMGFKEDLETILNASSRDLCRTWLFSATMSTEVRKVADKYLKEPRFIQVNRTEVLSNTVEQLFYAARETNKPDILCKIIEAADDFYGIVFCQTKLLVVDLTRHLTEKGYKVDCLHGDKDQWSREKTIQAFRERRVSILVCTDVASRGLDVKDVSHVINYSIPRELDLYVHRIGRTARSGKKGIAMSLVTPTHRYLISRLEQVTKSKIKEGILPTRKDIGIKKVASVLGNFKGQEGYGRALNLLGEEWKKALSKMTSEEVAARFLSMNYPDLFEDREKERVTLGVPGHARQGYDAGHQGHARTAREKSAAERKSEKIPPWKRNKYSVQRKGRFNNSKWSKA